MLQDLANAAYLEVISKVVPKIWALINSAMVTVYMDCFGERWLLYVVVAGFWSGERRRRGGRKVVVCRSGVGAPRGE